MILVKIVFFQLLNQLRQCTVRRSLHKKVYIPNADWIIHFFFFVLICSEMAKFFEITKLSISERSIQYFISSLCVLLKFVNYISKFNWIFFSFNSKSALNLMFFLNNWNSEIWSRFNFVFLKLLIVKYVRKPIDFSILDDVGHGVRLAQPQQQQVTI